MEVVAMRYGVHSMRAFATVAAVLLAVGVAALAWLADPADAKGGKKKGPKPDLVVERRGTTAGQDYLFRNEDGTASFTDRTANVEKVTAGKSRTALVLIHAPEVDRTVVASRAVPKLKKEESDSGIGAETFGGNLPPGEYFAFVCADIDDKVKEKKEGNNCRALTERVYVIARAWDGQLNGSGPTVAGDGVTETWSSYDASLRFVEYLGDGQFTYAFRGSVTYSISGTDSDGCAYSGSDTAILSGDAEVNTLTLDHRSEEYSGSAGVPLSSFTWKLVCEGFVEDYLEGPLSWAQAFIDVNPQDDFQPLPFGSRLLAGSSTDEFGSQFSWFFVA
jgi:hypothetical protein